MIFVEMLSLSQSVGYAVRALVCMESRTCAPHYTRDIAQCSGVPAAYLPKVFQKLATAEILVSKRGRSGGMHLARAPENISLLDIAEALEGKDFLPECLLGEDFRGPGFPCPCHEFWPKQRDQLLKELSRLTLARILSETSAEDKAPCARRRPNSRIPSSAISS